jgi:DNA-3-methyladenine glycosylase I
MSDTFTDNHGVARCSWCAGSERYTRYHDQEWGFPVGDDRRLFEKICLEGFQSGLSWLTILNKRENFRAAFDDFDFEKIAEYSERDVERLLADPGIIRHRGKIEAAINNARRARELISEQGSIAAYAWSFEPKGDIPHLAPTSPASVAMSKDLKGRGWKFVGPTTMHAFMQAMGLINDHAAGCAFRAEAESARAAFSVPTSSRPVVD